MPPSPPEPLLQRVAVFAATPAQLVTVHQTLASFWRAAAAERGATFDSGWVAMFETAVAEIAANIAQHAYVSPPPGDAELTLSLFADRVESRFVDRGQALVPATSSDPTRFVDDSEESGRGLALARAAADRVDYERIGPTNAWTITKFR